MTIIYQYRVATSSLCGFLRLLAAWRGSVYKLIYKEMLIFALLYAAISLVYRLGLNQDQRVVFEDVARHCSSFLDSIPMSFVLGFYVTVVVGRWWTQFQNIPWPDRTLFLLSAYLHGYEDRARIMRRSVGRYLLFAYILITRSISVAVMKRFPSLDHVVQAGFITKEEREQFDLVQCRYHKFWVPLAWARDVLVTARREGRISSDFGLRMVLEPLADFRDKCSTCFVYDWITIPLVYTQVVTIAVYTYLGVCLLGNQFLDPAKQYPGYESDFYVPVVTLARFFFYMGWLKVAEQLINPFGEDDDDYDLNWLLDRHTAVAFCLTDQCYGKHPYLVKDQFYDDVDLPDLPYTLASLHSRRPNFLGSTFNIAPHSLDEQPMVVPPEVPDQHRRSKSSMAGSLASLLPTKAWQSGSTYLPRDPHAPWLGSQTTLPGNSERRASIDVAALDLPEVNSRRMRSSTDADSRDVKREKKVKRKLSAPLQFFHRRKVDSPMINRKEKKADASNGAGRDSPKTAQRSRSTSESPKSIRKKSATDSPKISRFQVEPVAGDTVGEEPRRRKSGQVMVALEKQLAKQNAAPRPQAAVSRSPRLSAIEEGGTVTSLKQILDSPVYSGSELPELTEADGDHGPDSHQEGTGSHDVTRQQTPMTSHDYVIDVNEALDPRNAEDSCEDEASSLLQNVSGLHRRSPVVHLTTLGPQHFWTQDPGNRGEHSNLDEAPHSESSPLLKNSDSVRALGENGDLPRLVKPTDQSDEAFEIPFIQIDHC